MTALRGTKLNEFRQIGNLILAIAGRAISQKASVSFSHAAAEAVPDYVPRRE
jgi:hypothetical protein